MAKFAVIETGGKQYKVKEGEKIKVEKLDGETGKSISFDKVLLVAGEKTEIGHPYLKGATVEAVISSVGRSEKKIIFRYHSKTRYRKLKGHRQHYTEVTVGSIKI
ncbi:50S ribosomal protein L21 [Patescibacteria group bacterium]|nr:50S ribosomal protein L21 [Patescibacteria group bacterium]MCL5114356.1 50S ribosomal protein L21 [Patescibacteria group bacterium]